MQIKKLMITGAIFTAVALVQAKQPIEKRTWKTIETKGDMVVREENSAVYYKGQYMLIGGRGIIPVSILDLKTNTWHNGAKPPLEIHHFQSMLFNGLVYAVCAQTGGYPHEVPLPNIYIYNPSTDTWTKGAEIPANRRRGSAGCVVYNKKFYIVSGILDGHWNGHVKWFDEYDPATGKWTKLPDAPRARDHFEAVVVNNKLYCIGGRRSSGVEKKVFEITVPEVDVFDFKTQKWRTLPTVIPTQRAGTTNVVSGNEIIVIGGESIAHKVAHNECEAYNVKTGLWRTLPHLVEGRHGTGVVTDGKKLYIASGAGNLGGAPKLSTAECFGK